MNNIMPNSALNWILRAEGCYVNNPHDPGGPTNRGITQKTLDYSRLKGLTKTRLVQDLTNDDVRSIYGYQYWEPSHAGELASTLALIHFDCAVNCGVTQAAKLLRRAVNAVSDKRKVNETSGVCSELIAIINGLPAVELAEAYLTVRLAFYKSLGNYKVFGNGWTNRLNSLAKYLNIDWTGTK